MFWQAGPLATLYLAGILSANLALVNILPFPPLDGGRMLMIVLKCVVGNRISLQAERLTYLVGLRVPVRLPDLDHVLRHRRQIGSGTQ